MIIFTNSNLLQSMENVQHEDTTVHV